MAKLIIDITELVNWSGRLSGVPRVINELSSRFVQNNEAHFVFWSKVDHNFYELEADFFSDDKSGESAAELSRQTAKRKSKIISIAKKIKNQYKVTSYISNNSIQAIRAMPMLRTNNKSRPTFKLQPEDKLLIMADWHGDDPFFLQRLKNLKSEGVQIIQMCYDLLPIITPQFSGHSTGYITHYCKEIYPMCDLIISISKNTRDDIKTWLGQNKLHVPQIEVIRLGDDFDFAQPSKPLDEQFIKSGLKGNDYILCVGTIEARKNHTLIYYTYKLAKERGITLPKIVIVGRRGWMTENIFEIIKNDPEIKDQIIFLQNTTDEELSWLYGKCLLSIYPSFYEGWGLPIAESLARGVPCACSNTSSMPEVAGDLAVYFSPASTNECLSAITSLIEPKKLSEEKKRIRAYKPTSWDSTYESVKQYIGVLND